MKAAFAIVAVGVASFVTASPAQAQAWLGQLAVDSAKSASQGGCLGGAPLAPEEYQEAKVKTVALMERLWDSWKDPAAAKKTGAGRWIRGEAVTKRPHAIGLKDPLAPSASLKFVPEPLSFARAGAEPLNDAVGVWKITSAENPDQVQGYYRVKFFRFMLKWEVSAITVSDASAPPEGAAPFCVYEGDIERFAIASAERAAQKAAKQAAKVK